MMRRCFGPLVGIVLSTVALAQGALPSVSVQEAHQQASAGKMVIVDIRTPQEWAETGVAAGAVKLDMTEKDFPARLAALQKQAGDKAVGLICRTANRSSYVQDALAKYGMKLVNIRGGMAGGRGETGWIAAGLPVNR